MRMDNGFSLVEIMVGMVIGLLGIIIITQIFALAEGQKRTTTSGSDAQTNGNIALYTIERDVRQAGYGLSLDALGCSTSTSLAGNTATPLERAPYANGIMVLAPVILIDGGTNAAGDALPDTLRTLYSTNTVSSLPQKLQFTHAQSDTLGTIGSTFNVADLDMVVFQETGKDCALVQVTGAPPTATTFNHNGGQWNNSAILPGAGYATGASVFDLGSMAFRRYFIDPADDNLLRFQEVNANGNTGSVNAVVAASEIVNLQAQYGQDNGVNNGTVPAGPYAASDGKVDSWDTATPGLVPPAGAGTNAQWQQIIAVRIAILARSGQYEKPDPVLGCTATTVAPSWSGGTMAVPPFPNAGLPSCYRYKMFETVVPLRNVIWGM
jgi:type IV pilus assembly protein PilW